MSAGFREAIEPVWRREGLPPVELYRQRAGRATARRPARRPSASPSARALGDCPRCGPASCKGAVRARPAPPRRRRARLRRRRQRPVRRARGRPHVRARPPRRALRSRCACPGGRSTTSTRSRRSSRRWPALAATDDGRHDTPGRARRAPALVSPACAAHARAVREVRASSAASARSSTSPCSSSRCSPGTASTTRRRFAVEAFASGLAFAVAVVNNYLLNRWWTFRSTGPIHIEFGKFLTVSLAGLVAQRARLLRCSVARLDLHVMLSQLLAIGCVLPFNFVVNKLWSFRGVVRRRSRARTLPPRIAGRAAALSRVATCAHAPRARRACCPHLWYGLHDITRHPRLPGLRRAHRPGPAPVPRLRDRVPAAGRAPLPPARPRRRRRRLRPLVQHRDGRRHAARRGRDGPRRLPPVAARRPRLRRPPRCSPSAVALTGAIIVNRYDAAVALLVAVLPAVPRAERWYIAAAFVLGLGFALKITPAAMLPLVLLLVRARRAAGSGRWSPSAPRPSRRSCPTCSRRRAASGTSSSTTSSGRCRSRACSARRCCSASCSAPAGPSYGWSHGSHSLVAPGVGIAANLSGGLTLIALAGVYALVWRRRDAAARGAAGPAARRPRAHPRADDLRQGALAAVLHLDPAGGRARRRPRPPARRPRPRHAAAHAGRVPGALLARCSRCAPTRSPSSSRATAAGGLLRRRRCGASGPCRTRQTRSARQALRGSRTRWRFAPLPRRL